MRKRWLLAVVLAVLIGGTHGALAHPDKPIAPHDLWEAWNDDAFLLLALELGLFVYLFGIARLWSRAGVGRGVPVWRAAAYLVGLLSLGVALVSPLDALSGALFSAHMGQHLVLMLVAAPLLVLSDAPVVVLWALPRRWARSLGQSWRRLHVVGALSRFFTRWSVLWLLFATALWVWHSPGLYQAALRDETIHALEHGTFFVTALAYWSALLNSAQPKRSQYGLAFLYLFTTALQSGILGALITFASNPWYPYYAATVTPWGLSTLEDQQLAGVLMWLPAGAVFTLLALIYFRAWLVALEQRPSASVVGDGLAKTDS